jgi:hypothetical protein
MPRQYISGKDSSRICDEQGLAFDTLPFGTLQGRECLSFAEPSDDAFWEALFTAMQDNQTVADEQELEVTGIPVHAEQKLSSIFVPPISINVRPGCMSVSLCRLAAVSH